MDINSFNEVYMEMANSFEDGADLYGSEMCREMMIEKGKVRSIDAEKAITKMHIEEESFQNLLLNNDISKTEAEIKKYLERKLKPYPAEKKKKLLRDMIANGNELLAIQNPLSNQLEGLDLNVLEDQALDVILKLTERILQENDSLSEELKQIGDADIEGYSTGSSCSAGSVALYVNEEGIRPMPEMIAATSSLAMAVKENSDSVDIMEIIAFALMLLAAVFIVGVLLESAGATVIVTVIEVIAKEMTLSLSGIGKVFAFFVSDFAAELKVFTGIGLAGILLEALNTARNWLLANKTARSQLSENKTLQGQNIGIEDQDIQMNENLKNSREEMDRNEDEEVADANWNVV